MQGGWLTVLTDLYNVLRYCRESVCLVGGREAAGYLVRCLGRVC